MPRSVRIQYAGAIYHVLCRGDHRESISRDDTDRTKWVEALAEVCDRTGFRVHSYVLMPNHYHLLLETPEPNLIEGMKWFQGTYTQRYNRRHDAVGHLFQGRYKAVPVDPEDAAYFRTVSDYIHLNPARARLLKTAESDLASYPWSSYPAFLGRQRPPEWLVRDRVLSSHGLGNDGAVNRRRYQTLFAIRVREVLAGVAAPEETEQLKQLRRGWFLGGDRFRDKLMDRADALARGHKRTSYRGDALRTHDERTADRLLQQALTALDTTLPQLWARSQTDPTKQAVAWWIKRNSVAKDAWLTDKLEMGCRTNISRAVTAYRSPTDPTRALLRNKLHKCAD